MTAEIDTALLERGASDLGITLTAAMTAQFQRYATLLATWNELMDLTAVPVAEFVIRHFLDSLTLLGVPEAGVANTLIDVGTGAGFPGIPCAIVRPTLAVTLLDALQKRVTFLQSVATELSLQNITAFHGRSELVAHDEMHRGKYDLVTARAVAPLHQLVEVLLPLVRTGGFVIALKGPEAAREFADAERAITLCGGILRHITRTPVPFSDAERNLVVIEKIAGSDQKYPRSNAAIQKRPLR